MFLSKENPLGTSFDPGGSQSGNQGGVNFIMANETIDEKGIKDTHRRFSN